MKVTKSGLDKYKVKVPPAVNRTLTKAADTTKGMDKKSLRGLKDL